MFRFIFTCFALACLSYAYQPASAAPYHFEGFENPAWTPGGDNWNNFNGGDIERATSGTAGITSSTGSAHAVITNLSTNNDVFGNPSLGAGGPFTRFDGYSNTFGPGFTARLDVYLDPSWSDGQGFDYAVAASRQDGSHLRDFVWHVGGVGTDLLVNASNNSDLNYNAFKLQNENGGNNYTVTSAGWYTLEQDFYDDGGFLSVDMNLYDSSGTELYSVTRTTNDSIATTVGGNRYGWFTYNNIDGLALDNTELLPVPEPGSIALLSLGGLFGATVYLRRRWA